MIVAYFAEHSPVAPEVDNNWKIVGVDLSEDDPRRAELIGYINDGLLDPPYAASYNLADYDALVAEAQANAAAQEGNLSVDGTVVGNAFVYASGDTSYFRLRDVAYALKDTAAAFDVSWDNGVVLTRGGTYAGEPVEDSTMPPAFSEVTLSVQVDGQTVEVPAVLMTPGNYCVTAEVLGTLLGVSVTVVDDVLTITTTA